MRKSLGVLSVLSLFVGVSGAHAQDEVLVDLSVLEGLSTQESSYEGRSSVNVVQPSVETTIVETVVYPTAGEPQTASAILNLPPVTPKFPVVKAQPKKSTEKVAKKSPAKTSVDSSAKKTKPARKATTAPKAPQNNNAIVECDKRLAKKENNKAKQTVVAKENSEDLYQADSSPDVYRIIREFEESQKLEKGIQTEKLEYNQPLQESETQVKNQVVTPVVATVKAVPTSIQENVSAQKNVVEAKAQTAVETTSQQVQQNVTSLQQKAVSQVENSVEKTNEAVSDVKPILKNVSISNLVHFQDGSSELTSVEKAKIDAILKTFENPQENKISIVAYKLDDGNDSFSRNKVCLNRATEIRSYLLSKGYKGFKIKVVNIEAGSNKLDSVELSEIK